ncbi:acyl carrier protein [Streptomyces sp. NPDC015131]|uniref:acyl carrier protein n=1 Tax=Streptomyces sp. NPDC015131 TaxID=3364941 RepID=UPI0036FB694C
MNDITSQVTDFLSAALRRPVEPDDDYFAQGLADSLFALELVTFVEHRFALTIEVEDLDLDSFRTAHRITEFVRRKTGSPEAAGAEGAAGAQDATGAEGAVGAEGAAGAEEAAGAERAARTEVATGAEEAARTEAGETREAGEAHAEGL